MIGAIASGPVLFGDFFAQGVVFDKVIAIGDNHPALHDMAEEFHGWFAMALHSVSGLPVWLALAGVVVSWFLYWKRTDLPAGIKQRFLPIYNFLYNTYYLDKTTVTNFLQVSL